MQFSRKTKTVLLLLALVLLIAIPWIASDYFVMMCIRVMYFGMLTLSLCFLAGELGVVSLMQASFFGIAGYFIAILQTRYQIPFPIPPLVGIGVAVLFAAMTGLLVIRVQGIYFFDADAGARPTHLGAGKPMGIGYSRGLGHHRHICSSHIRDFYRKVKGSVLSIRTVFLLQCDLFPGSVKALTLWIDAAWGP